MNAGIIRWRQHEMILTITAAVIVFAGYLWTIYHASIDIYATPFIDNNVSFDLFKNVILPDVAMGLVIFLSYLWISLYTIPRLLFPKKFEAGTSKIAVSLSKVSLQGFAKKMLREYAWLFIQIAIIIFIAGCVFDLSTYLRHQWQFNYPGFSIFFNSNNPKSQLSLSEGFFVAASLLFLYGLYLCVREIIIHIILTSKQKEYNILICNKVTGFIVLLALLPVVLLSFNIVHQPEFFLGYVLVIPAFFAMFISNVYWLFPKKGDDAFFSKKIMIRLLSTSFVYAVPLVVFVHEEVPIAFLYSWALQLFVVTPITWWYYKTYEDKILQLRVIEKQLVKSKTDLQFLRSQINPHFLFNVLNTLYGIALQENAELTAESIQKLGDMMRFMLHENNLDFIDMNKETTYLKNYIALQKLRTQSSPNIIIEDNINEQNCNHKIAPMLLIPFVENAFKHGISLKEKSWIRIHLACDEKEIRFEVHNSMHEKTKNDTEKEKSGIGFKNVLKRLILIYGGRHQISVNADGKEFFVKLAIQP
jgi:two-component system, LytTR family, sensor kinase